jgi:HK97 family phage portal protein
VGFVANTLARSAVGERRAQVSGIANPESWLQNIFGGELTAAGKRVTAGSALTLSAVFAAVRLLSFSVAVLPLPLYRRQGRGKERVTGHPVYRLLNQRPNAWQTAFEFRAMLQAHLCLRGNAFAEIRTTRAGSITDLVPLHPDRVTVLLTPEELPVYEYQSRQGAVRRLAREDVMHLRGLSLDGFLGISVVSAAAEGLGLSMAAEEHAARFYSNDASPSGVLTHPGKLTKEGKERLRDGWSARHQGSGNAHKTALLEEGVKWEAIGISQKDQQFLEQRQFQLGEVARWFNVPPHMIGDLLRSTNNNIEQQGLDFVRYSLQPWLET